MKKKLKAAEAERAAAEHEREEERRARLELQDALDDIRSGIDFWKAAKLAEVCGSAWDGIDEALMRWVDRAP